VRSTYSVAIDLFPLEAFHGKALAKTGVVVRVLAGPALMAGDEIRMLRKILT